jgi:hypothetical protein
MSWAGDGTALLAKSPFFTISDPVRGAGSSGSGSPVRSSPTPPTLPPQFRVPRANSPGLTQRPTSADSQSGDGPGISKPVAIGLGVAIGVPSVAGAVVVGWCFRKRQRRAAMEKRQLKRSEFVIH